MIGKRTRIAVFGARKTFNRSVVARLREAGIDIHLYTDQTGGLDPNVVCYQVSDASIYCLLNCVCVSSKVSGN